MRYEEQPESSFLKEAIVPIPDLSKTESVARSLRTYTDIVRTRGDFEKIKTEHIRIPYAYMDIQLLPPITDAGGSYFNYGSHVSHIKDFYIDGDYGLMLGAKVDEQKDVRPLALASFSVDHEKNTVLIDQIQGRLRSNRLLEEEKTILQAYRWEFMLVNLIKSWAEQVHISSLGIRSVQNLPYKSSTSQSFLGYRYNKTAKRLGFTKEESTGDYILPLR